MRTRIVPARGVNFQKLGLLIDASPLVSKKEGLRGLTLLEDLCVALGGSQSHDRVDPGELGPKHL